MNAILLLVHILLAVVSLVFTAMVVLKTALKKTTHQPLKGMWSGTVATLLTGVVLALVTHSPVGSTCVSLFGFLAVITVAQAYHVLAAVKTTD